jgi:hypothetical protein
VDENDKETYQSSLSWVKRDVKQMLAEMLGLSVKRRGIFQTVLDLICLNGGCVPDDDEYIMGFLRGCNSRDSRTTRDYLIKIGYLYRDDFQALRSRFADDAYGFARKPRKPKLMVVQQAAS